MMGDQNMHQWKAGLYFVLGRGQDESFLLNLGLKLQATQWAQNWGLMGEYNILPKLIYNLDELVYDGGMSICL